MLSYFQFDLFNSGVSDVSLDKDIELQSLCAATIAPAIMPANQNAICWIVYKTGKDGWRQEPALRIFTAAKERAFRQTRQSTL